MVRYYGRARQRTGSVNTNQLGLKMSGCPGKVGLNPVNNRYIQHRVSCMRGVCGIPRVHGVDWRVSMNNTHPYCAEPSSKCLAAAGGIGNIYTPYFKSLQPGKQGCTNKDQFGFAAPNANIDPVVLQASHFPYGAKVTTNADGSLTVYHGEVPITIKGDTLNIPTAAVPKLARRKGESTGKVPQVIRIKPIQHLLPAGLSLPSVVYHLASEGVDVLKYKAEEATQEAENLFYHLKSGVRNLLHGFHI